MQPLDQLLRIITPVENLQLTTGKNVNDMHLDYASHSIPKMPQSEFFKEGNIFINKHHRFSYMPAHTHNFVEFNYMYSGTCTQFINDEKITLNRGEIILMDKDIVQKIDYVGQNDILINILVQDKAILTDLLDTLSKSDDLVTRFIVNASKTNAIHNNFIIFNIANNPIAIQLIESLILKSYQHDKFRNHSMNLLLSLILTELANTIESQSNDLIDEQDELLKILKFINEHFKTVSLKQLGQQFGYNKNYISNKLKKETGQSFQTLIDKKRVAAAKQLLAETNYSVTEIAELLGYSSTPSLFRLFTKYCRTTPNEFREKNK